MQTHWQSVRFGDRRSPGWADQLSHEQLGEPWVPHIESCNMLQFSRSTLEALAVRAQCLRQLQSLQELEGGTLAVLGQLPEFPKPASS